MSGVITTVKGITFPSFAWKKCFSPRKVRWRIEATFFTGDCIVASRESCGPYVFGVNETQWSQWILPLQGYRRNQRLARVLRRQRRARSVLRNATLGYWVKHTWFTRRQLLVVTNNFPHQMPRFTLLGTFCCIVFSQALTILNSGVFETNDRERRLHPDLTTLGKMVSFDENFRMVKTFLIFKNRH